MLAHSTGALQSSIQWTSGDSFGSKATKHHTARARNHAGVSISLWSLSLLSHQKAIIEPNPNSLFQSNHTAKIQFVNIVIEVIITF